MTPYFPAVSWPSCAPRRGGRCSTKSPRQRTVLEVLLAPRSTGAPDPGAARLREGSPCCADAACIGGWDVRNENASAVINSADREVLHAAQGHIYGMSCRAMYRCSNGRSARGMWRRGDRTAQLRACMHAHVSMQLRPHIRGGYFEPTDQRAAPRQTNLQTSNDQTSVFWFQPDAPSLEHRRSAPALGRCFWGCSTERCRIVHRLRASPGSPCLLHRETRRLRVVCMMLL